MFHINSLQLHRRAHADQQANIVWRWKGHQSQGQRTYRQITTSAPSPWANRLPRWLGSRSIPRWHSTRTSSHHRRDTPYQPPLHEHHDHLLSHTLTTTNNTPHIRLTSTDCVYERCITAWVPSAFFTSFDSAQPLLCYQPFNPRNFYFDNPYGIWLCRAIVSLLAQTIIPRHA